MNDPIQVDIGVQSEKGHLMSFLLYDIGAKIHDDFTPTDLRIAVAVLRDLADALEAKSRQIHN